MIVKGMDQKEGLRVRARELVDDVVQKRCRRRKGFCGRVDTEGKQN